MMSFSESRKLGELFIKIGKRLKENANFLKELEEFLDSSKDSHKTEINIETIDKLDLFKLIREKTEQEIDVILQEFNIKELREILKKYYFGSSSKFKNTAQIRQHIINQLRQRKTDVFHNPEAIESIIKDDISKSDSPS